MLLRGTDRARGGGAGPPATTDTDDACTRTYGTREGDRRMSRPSGSQGPCPDRHSVPPPVSVCIPSAETLHWYAPAFAHLHCCQGRPFPCCHAAMTARERCLGGGFPTETIRLCPPALSTLAVSSIPAPKNLWLDILPSPQQEGDRNRAWHFHFAEFSVRPVAMPSSRRVCCLGHATLAALSVRGLADR